MSGGYVPVIADWRIYIGISFYFPTDVDFQRRIRWNLVLSLFTENSVKTSCLINTL